MLGALLLGGLGLGSSARVNPVSRVKEYQKSPFCDRTEGIGHGVQGPLDGVRGWHGKCGRKAERADGTEC